MTGSQVSGFCNNLLSIERRFRLPSFRWSPTDPIRPVESIKSGRSKHWARVHPESRPADAIVGFFDCSANRDH